MAAIFWRTEALATKTANTPHVREATEAPMSPATVSRTGVRWTRSGSRYNTLYMEQPN